MVDSTHHKFAREIPNEESSTAVKKKQMTE